jgi:hypothetical protein
MRPGMNTQIKRALMAGLLAAGSALADGNTQVHPGYAMTDIQPAGTKFLVGGLDFFSNGDMAICNWGNPGDVYIMKNPNGTPTVKKFASGMQQVLGCRVVHDTVFVMQMGELTAVIDTDHDGVADEYQKINDNFSTSESLLGYSYDVEYLHGSFYAVLSSDVKRGGMDASPSLANRSVFIRMGRDNTTDMLSSGFRNPNGMGIGYGNRLFVSDNQGSWTPLSKIIYLQKGKFYGHHNHTPAPFENEKETWPMLWLPRATVDYQPGNLAYISKGIFKGQFFFAEPDDRIKGRIYRIYAEDVGGVMQGGIVAFSGGLYGVMRVAVSPTGDVYAGNLNSNGGWNTLSSMGPGLKRLTPKGDVNQAAAFEILAVRSTGANTLEIEYTKPVAAGGSYSIHTWTVDPIEAYGGNSNIDPHDLTVSNATIKPDGKTVTLTVSGMKLKYILDIKLNGIKSSTGEAPWGAETWFTLNAIGPGKVPADAACMDVDQYTGSNYPPDCGVTDVVDAAGGIAKPGLTLVGSDRIDIALPATQSYSLHLYDVLGVERKVWHGTGPAAISAFAETGLAKGLYFARLQAGAFSTTVKLVRP